MWLNLPPNTVSELAVRVAPLSGGGHFAALARVAEWQTQQTQNLPGATPCEFDSRLGHS